MSEYYNRNTLIGMAKDYRQPLYRLSAVFGKENIILRTYEAGKWVEGSLVVDFLANLGVRVSAGEVTESFRKPGRGNANPTLNVNALYILDALTCLGVDYQLKQMVTRYLLRVESGDRSTIVSDKLADDIDRSCALSNRELARDWFGCDELFTESSSFKYREPETERIDKYFANIWKWHPAVRKVGTWERSQRFMDAVKAQKVELIRGFYPVEENGVWMRGEEIGELRFRVPDTVAGDLQIRLEGRYLDKAGTRSWIALQDGEWHKIGGRSLELEVPEAHYCERYGHVCIQFAHRDAVSPVEVGVSQVDTRIVGYRLTDLSYTPLQ